MAWLASLGLAAQTVNLSPLMKEAMNDIAHLRYPAMERKLQLERQRNPQNRAPDYLEAASLCIKLFINENEASFDRREEHLDRLIDRIAELPEEEPFKKVFMGEIFLAKATLQGKFENNLRAAWLFYRAYNLLKANFKEHPDFVPTYLPWGVLNAGLGSLPDDYRNIASFLGFKGDIREGISLVRRAYYESIADESGLGFYEPYFGFVYVYINYQLEGNENVDLAKLGFDVEKSGFFIFLQTKILLDKGKAQEAYRLLLKRPSGSEYLNFNYLNYLTGKVSLSLEPEQAPFYLKTFMRESANSDNIKSSCRYLAWYYLLKGQRDSAELARRWIFEKGQSKVGADKQALAEAQRGFNLDLIKARLDFDAGRYPQIIRYLTVQRLKNCCAKPWEKTEFYYRRGRAFQEMGLLGQAMESYRKALSFGRDETTYALGNSALQLAALQEQQGDFSAAEKFYEMALDIQGYPFYEGIHQKAKTGLTRLP